MKFIFIYFLFVVENSGEFSPFLLAARFSTPAIVKLLLDHDGRCRRQVKLDRERTEIHGEILAERFYNMKLGDYDDEVASRPLVNSRYLSFTVLVIIMI